MLTPTQIAGKAISIGETKASSKTSKTFVLAVFAGAFIALGPFGPQIASLNAKNPATGKLLGALVFPIGLLMVLCAGAELFTGNSLILIPVLEGKVKLFGMLKNWVIVYLGNFLGGVLVALGVTCGGSLSAFEGLANAVVNTAVAKCSLSFTDALIRGIFCNILVCAAVWISFGAGELAGKITGLFLPVTLFVLCGFEHCVANMYFIPAGFFAAAEYGTDAGNLSISGFLLGNLLPVTLGNIIGGAVVVGAGYWFSYLKK